MSNNYFKVDPSKLDGLRVLASALNGTELMALVALWGLQSNQECNLDMISCGELDLEEIANVNTVESVTACASDMTSDMLNPRDLAEVIAVNNLAEPYLLDITVQVTAVARQV